MSRSCELQEEEIIIISAVSTMSLNVYEVREMTRPEVDLAVSWANLEGWNPGIHDAEPFYLTDPHGFFLRLLEGKPVSSISAVAYGDSFGFLGFYIVQPPFRGGGLGTEIWKMGMMHLQSRNVGLDAVLQQQKLYERLGFWPCYKSIRHQGAGTGEGKKLESIKILSDVPMDDLLAYDDRYFPVSRHAFIKSWIRQPEAFAVAAMDQDELAGYGVLRKCIYGYKIGPLFAEDELTADALFRALCGHARKGEPVFMDTPEPNSSALHLAERHKMHPVFETVRMYTGDDPNLPTEGIFGVTSFELG